MRKGDHLSPKGTVGITPVDGFTVYGTFAEGYRAPAITETLVAGAHPPFAVGFPNLFTFLPNANIRPEIGQTKEIGVNLKYDDVLMKGDKVRVKANVFRNDVQDYIELVQFGPPVTFTFCPAPVPGCPPVPNVTIPINSTSFAQVPEHRKRAVSRASSSRAPTTRATGSRACRVSTSAAAM